MSNAVNPNNTPSIRSFPSPATQHRLDGGPNNTRAYIPASSATTTESKIAQHSLGLFSKLTAELMNIIASYLINHRKELFRSSSPELLKINTYPRVYPDRVVGTEILNISRDIQKTNATLEGIQNGSFYQSRQNQSEIENDISFFTNKLEGFETRLVEYHSLLGDTLDLSYHLFIATPDSSTRNKSYTSITDDELTILLDSIPLKKKSQLKNS